MGGRVRFTAVHLSNVSKWRGVLAMAIVAVASIALVRGDRQAVIPTAVPATTRSLLRTEPIYSLPVNGRLVSFAVNIDWGGEFLPQMLDVFESRGTKVTFFPTGRWAALEPELTRKLVRAGHELGNHGYRHDHPKALGDAALRDHIVRNQQLLKDLTGVTTRLYAPPYGEVDGRVARISADTDHWTIMWTVDTVDWQRPSPEVIVRRVVPKVQPGAIVLMHPTAPTLAALPTMLDMLLADGWTVVPIGMLLDHVLEAQSGGVDDRPTP